jgi:allantoate deiminase
MSSIPVTRIWESSFGEDLRASMAKEVSKWVVWLSRYGAVTGCGVTRLLYDGAWQAAQKALEDRMEVIGLEVRTDKVGNTFGRLQGRLEAEGVIGVGSHLDTVRDGGRYDGAYGIIAALIAVNVLKNAYGAPRRSIEVAAFCEEEGSRFPLAYWGSGSATGARNPLDIIGLADENGIGFKEAMAAAGFGRESQREPLLTDWSAFIELHIEQGPVLEQAQAAIGVAEAIVGQKRYAFKLSGTANHAGTTPMGSRRDALAGAAEMIAALEEMALLHGDSLVATAGRLEVYPNTPNVIPGEVAFTADVRHSNREILDAFCLELEDRVRAIAEKRQLCLSTSLWVDTSPVPLDSCLSGLAEEAATARGLVCRRMASGAGHDAQMLQAMCPSALIFVPSRGGISHSPEEFTEPEQLADGILTLIDLLYTLAYEERKS